MVITRGSSQVYPAEQAFLRNHWYVAAFSPEIDDGALLHRTILNTPVLLYRTEDGRAAALYDRCPHRGLPLSMGKRMGNNVQCGYHGIQFGPDGRCRLIPSQPGTPAALSVPSYPVVEKWKWIWIWMGDAGKADEALIPDHEWLGIGVEGHTASIFMRVEPQCHYGYVNDNLLDTSHLSFVHYGTLDTGGLAGAKTWTEEDDDFLRVGRREPEATYSGELARFFRADEGARYSRTLVAEWRLPSAHVGKQQLTNLDDPEAPPLVLHAVNAVTPRDQRSTHMFHVMVSNYPDNCTPADLAGSQYVLQQDVVALEALQRGYDERGDTLEVSVTADGPGLRCRRMMKRAIQQEQGSIGMSTGRQVRDI